MLREAKGKSQLEVCAALNIEQSTLANYENDKRIPKIEILIKSANYINVSTDYLLEVGIFKDWDLLLNNKDEIIKYLSISMENLSENILHGIDDITFAKLVYAFDVSVIQRSDGNGVSLTDPIPTYSDNPFLKKDVEYKDVIDLFNSQTDAQKKDLINLVPSFCSLSEKNRTKVLGKCFDLEDSESVAAEEPSRRAVGK